MKQPSYMQRLKGEGRWQLILYHHDGRHIEYDENGVEHEVPWSMEDIAEQLIMCDYKNLCHGPVYIARWVRSWIESSRVNEAWQMAGERRSNLKSIAASHVENK
jgi:hypothetical protein